MIITNRIRRRNPAALPGKTRHAENFEYLSPTRRHAHLELPLNEIVLDFTIV